MLDGVRAIGEAAGARVWNRSGGLTVNHQDLGLGAGHRIAKAIVAEFPKLFEHEGPHYHLTSYPATGWTVKERGQSFVILPPKPGY